MKTDPIPHRAPAPEPQTAPEPASITITIDIGEAARRLLLTRYQSQQKDLDLIRVAVCQAQERLSDFAFQCGILDAVDLIPAQPATAPTVLETTNKVYERHVALPGVS